jgi:alginate O-acetyltransferase complex protein AlgI
VIACFSLPVVLWHLWGATEPWRRTWSAQTAERMTIGLHAVMLFLIITNSGPPGEFIYFQF